MNIFARRYYSISFPLTQDGAVVLVAIFLSAAGFKLMSLDSVPFSIHSKCIEEKGKEEKINSGKNFHTH